MAPYISFLFSLKPNPKPKIIDPQRDITNISHNAVKISVNLFSQAHIGVFCLLIFIC